MHTQIDRGESVKLEDILSPTEKLAGGLWTLFSQGRS